MGHLTDMGLGKTISGYIYLIAKRMKKFRHALSDCSWSLRELLMVLQAMISVSAFPCMPGRRKCPAH